MIILVDVIKRLGGVKVTVLSPKSSYLAPFFSLANKKLGLQLFNIHIELAGRGTERRHMNTHRFYWWLPENGEAPAVQLRVANDRGHVRHHHAGSTDGT